VVLTGKAKRFSATMAWSFKLCPLSAPVFFFYSPGPEVGVCILEVALARMLFGELLRPFVQILIEQIVVQWLVHDGRRCRRRLQGCVAGQTGELMGEAEMPRRWKKRVVIGQWEAKRGRTGRGESGLLMRLEGSSLAFARVTRVCEGEVVRLLCVSHQPSFVALLVSMRLVGHLYVSIQRNMHGFGQSILISAISLPLLSIIIDIVRRLLSRPRP
jgi:hypothetical protein